MCMIVSRLLARHSRAVRIKEKVPGRTNPQAKRLWRSDANRARNPEQKQMGDGGHTGLLATETERIKFFGCNG